MEPLESNIYSRALAEAKNDLLNIQHEIEQLSKRKEQLEAAIANLSPLLPQAKPTLNFPQTEAPNSTPTPAPVIVQPPLWKSILLSINGKGDSFTVKDALQALERIGRPVQSDNRFQIVRSAIKNKKDYFIQLGPGIYAVRRNEKEVSPEEKTS